MFATSGSGWGQVEPRAVSNGGDPTGSVGSITWTSWGDAQAVGTGISDYVAANQSVAEGTQESVRMVAFDLGTCQGKYMYQAVEWFFPQHGAAFDPNSFEDICIGAYWPLTAGTYTNKATTPSSAGPSAGSYVIDLSVATAAALAGSLRFVPPSGSRDTVFMFTGAMHIDGSLAIRSTGPDDRGQAFSGSWANLGLTLDDCGRFLTMQSDPPCSFTL